MPSSQQLSYNVLRMDEWMFIVGRPVCDTLCCPTLAHSLCAGGTTTAVTTTPAGAHTVEGLVRNRATEGVPETKWTRLFTSSQGCFKMRLIWSNVRMIITWSLRKG
eukprot:4639416-Amphidinium_carterae.1